VREHDPSLALFGGPDGLREVRRIMVTAAILLRPGGRLVIEHGDEQGDLEKGVPAVIMGHMADHEMSLLTPTLEGQPLWRDVSDHRDLTRRPRYTIAVRT
jgi:release factor glutamine methyltransferase